MNRSSPKVLLIGAVAGYLAGYALHAAGATPLGTQVTSAARSPEAAAHRNIPPTPTPPLFPGEANKPMHWSIDDLHKIYEARLAAQKAGIERSAQVGAPAIPAFHNQVFRTHTIATNFRVKYETPRPANLTGVLSNYDDVEQHEGVSDFYVITGGGGQMVVDGEIANREYRRARGNSGSDVMLLPGEFDGQPIRNGHIYTVAPGDWLAIPPNDPHWQRPAPGEGMAYLLLKVNIGLYPSSISR